MMLVRAKGVMWGKVRMQIPDWNPFVTIGIPIDELPQLVLDTLPEAEGNHPNFRFNFMADVQGTVSGQKKDIIIDDYTVDVSVSDSVWKTFLAEAPDGAPTPPETSLDKAVADIKSNTPKLKLKPKISKSCTCLECNPVEEVKGCQCPECQEIYLEALTPSKTHASCECSFCIKNKHPHEFEKPCLCKKCRADFLVEHGHKVEYEDWKKMRLDYDNKQFKAPKFCVLCMTYHKSDIQCAVAHDDSCTCDSCYDKDNMSMDYTLWEIKYTCPACDTTHANVPCGQKTYYCDICSTNHIAGGKHSKDPATIVKETLPQEMPIFCLKCGSMHDVKEKCMTLVPEPELIHLSCGIDHAPGKCPLSKVETCPLCSKVHPGEDCKPKCVCGMDHSKDVSILDDVEC